METHGIGPLFVAGIRLRWNAPPVHRAPTTEMEEPFRVARGIVVHLWPTTLGLVFGRWRKGAEYEQREGWVGRTEDDAIKEALSLVVGAPEGELEEGVDPRPFIQREWQQIVARRVGDEVEILEAPKFTRISERLLDELPRWKDHQDIVMVGKYRYWLHGRDYTLSREAERLDRRGPIEFLFGGARAWE